ncbi:MAG: hypothetical protein PHQ52_08320, partial [Candidatus Omnitrophica bacterium]|nr:hypothetical protein [Candidatus Omnitrophota bacterium]
MDKAIYEKHCNDLQKKYEDICIQCGVCCGANDGDPCEHLEKIGPKKYFCKIYDHRLGLQKTVSGKIFTCTTIRELIKNGAIRIECQYVRVA